MSEMPRRRKRSSDDVPLPLGKAPAVPPAGWRLEFESLGDDASGQFVPVGCRHSVGFVSTDIRDLRPEEYKILGTSFGKAMATALGKSVSGT